MLDEKQMSKITVIDDSKHYFMPHHAVVKDSSNTTRVRPVFNASAKNCDGLSLNSILMTGPNLLPDIVMTLVRWRLYQFAFVADISKMYLNILLDPMDWPLQTILWREKFDSPIETYALNTVTFGCCASPFLASRTLRQLAMDEGTTYPLAVPIIQSEIYMDDVLSGSSSIASAKEKQRQLTAMLTTGRFKLAKWMANSKELLKEIDPELVATQAALKVGAGFSVLGLVWEPSLDSFRFNVNLPEIKYPVTKRSILSTIAGMFDPSGWISPLIMPLKVLMQSLWLITKEWDEPLPDKEVKIWEAYHKDLGNLKLISLPRWVKYSPGSIVEIHGFADASKFAYAAVVYTRIIVGAQVYVRLLVSKTKIAPIKTISIPRLELCAAHLLTKLVKHLLEAKIFDSVPVHLWTDSRNTLYWIHSIPAKWPTFVANRTSEINTSLPQAHWHYISTKVNPADIATRGRSVEELKNEKLWWEGPPCLSFSTEPWPAASELKVRLEEPVSLAISHAIELDSWFIDKFSSLLRLVNVTEKIIQSINILTKNHNGKLVFKYSDAKDMKTIMSLLCKIVQRRYFEKEIKLLESGAQLPRKSNMYTLSPTLKDGLIRVGGRLRNASLHEDEKFPIILPHQSHLVQLLIAHFHDVTMHGGIQLIISQIRKRYWVPRLKDKVKYFVNNCVKCKRFKAITLQQKMADLPAPRVQISRPFSRVGLDYAGPITLKASKFRGLKTFKGYFVVFVCMATKAAHLEAVSGYDTISFISAFKRFIARRGPCFEIYSDQGTNFVGANSELQRLFAKNSEIYSEMAKIKETKWHFNPPGAPHFGGLWESCVRAVKFHLKRCIGETILTYEEFSTLITQVEAILNSRPLIPLSDDSSEELALTSAHFLIGESSMLLAEPLVLEEKVAPLERWKRVLQIAQAFWKRWTHEYLQALQRRAKWHNVERNIKIGDIVLIKNELVPPSQWPLGKIAELRPGRDGIVRVAIVETAKATYTRRIVKLVPLVNSTDKDQ